MTYRNVVVALFVVVLCVVSAPVRADEIAAYFPKDVMFYAEIRRPGEVLAFVPKWLKAGGLDATFVDEAVSKMAEELKLKPEALRAEVAKFGPAAFSLVDIGERPGGRDFVKWMWVVDLGTSKTVRAAVEKAMVAEAPEIVATIGDVKVYGSENLAACVLRNRLIVGAPSTVVTDAVARMNDATKPRLTGSARFKKAKVGFDANALGVAYSDMQHFRKRLLEVGGRDDTVRAVEAFFNLETVETLAGTLHLKQGRPIANVSAILNAENDLIKAVHTKADARSVGRFFSEEYGMLHTGTLVDGKAQWKAFGELMGKVFAAAEHRNEFVELMGGIEETLEIDIGDELANVTEYGWGLRFLQEGGRRRHADMLFVLKVKDVKRMRAVMKKIEEVSEMPIQTKKVMDVEVRFLAAEEADSDYAYAFMGDYVFAASHVRTVEEAVRTRKGNKCILDVPEVKRALVGLHHPHAKLLVLNLQKLPPIRREEHAKPQVIAITDVESARRIDARGDLTGFAPMLQLFMPRRAFGGRNDRPLRKEAVGVEIR